MILSNLLFFVLAFCFFLTFAKCFQGIILKSLNVRIARCSNLFLWLKTSFATSSASQTRQSNTKLSSKFKHPKTYHPLFFCLFTVMFSCGSPDSPSISSPHFLYPYETWSDIDGDYIASSSCGHTSLFDQTTTYLSERYQDGVERLTNEIQTDQLKKFSAEAHAAIISVYPIVSSSESKRVEDLFNSLRDISPKSIRKSLKVHLVSSGQVCNAFTVAGGKVYITTAMLKTIKNDDELALVLGHEISHQIKGHTTLKLRQQNYLIDNLGEVGGKLTDAIINLITFPFSAPEEYEADCGGMWLCAQAGFNVERGILIFSRWANQERSAPRNSFISTHPKASQRFACCTTLTVEAKERASSIK